MLGNIGPLEIIVVLIIALIVFGPKRLPELGNSLGKGIREFKDSVTGDNKDDDSDDDVKTISASQATTTPVEPPTTHRVEADKAEVVHDKNG
ncbi:MAG TPA: twin-arginine translocase TatA/TatE family subunit [Solirubrobacterales bacterium]|nr:twin-arginine translocase TatA/TatE family subunit [Solirubrobacterales bacterium]